MEDNKAGESDSDFASAESDQAQESLKVTPASNSSPTTDDVTTAMTSSLQDNSPRANEEDTNPTVVHDVDETATKDDNTLQSEQIVRTQTQTTSVHSVATPSEQTEPVKLTDNNLTSVTSSAADDVTSSPPDSLTAPVTDDVSGKEQTKQEQNKVCLFICLSVCLFVCLFVCLCACLCICMSAYMSPYSRKFS